MEIPKSAAELNTTFIVKKRRDRTHGDFGEESEKWQNCGIVQARVEKRDTFTRGSDVVLYDIFTRFRTMTNLHRLVDRATRAVYDVQTVSRIDGNKRWMHIQAVRSDGNS